MIFFEVFLVFLLGLAVGSFTGVVVEREGVSEKSKVKSQKSKFGKGSTNILPSWVLGRSRCDSCKREIAWYDNIPLLSFVLLGGKCRRCHSPIPLRYPLVELLMGLLFVLAYLLNSQFLPGRQADSIPHSSLLTFNFSLFTLSSPLVRLLVIWVLLWALVAISLVDIRFGLIPDSVLIISGVLPLFLYLFLYQNLLIPNLLWGTVATLSFVLLVVLTRGRGMGWGDVKLAFWMGLWLGWEVLIALWLAFLTGAIGGIILILLKKRRWEQTVPFGPFLAFGTLVAAFAGRALVNLIFPGTFP